MSCLVFCGNNNIKKLRVSCWLLMADSAFTFIGAKQHWQWSKVGRKWDLNQSSSLKLVRIEPCQPGSLSNMLWHLINCLTTGSPLVSVVKWTWFPSPCFTSHITFQCTAVASWVIAFFFFSPKRNTVTEVSYSHEFYERFAGKPH